MCSICGLQDWAKIREVEGIVKRALEKKTYEPSQGGTLDGSVRGLEQARPEPGPI